MVSYLLHTCMAEYEDGPAPDCINYGYVSSKVPHFINGDDILAVG